MAANTMKRPRTETGQADLPPMDVNMAAAPMTLPDFAARFAALAATVPSLAGTGERHASPLASTSSFMSAAPHLRHEFGSGPAPPTARDAQRESAGDTRG